MCDGSEMRESPVGRGFTPAASSDNEIPAAINDRPTESSRYSLPATRCSASFDAEKLHAQLADLLQIYLKRASDPDAVAKCSAKDAIACAKTLTGMMSDFQSGKLKSRSGDLQVATPLISRPGDRASAITGGAGACPPRRRYRRVPPVIPPRRGTSLPATPKVPEGPRPTGHPLTPSPQPPVSILADALSVVLASTEESPIPEPYKRLIARIQKLCIETQKRLDASQNNDSPVGVYPPGRARHAVPSDDGDGEDSVVQPRPGGQAFRAGSSDDKTRAKALDYRDRRQRSRASESPTRQGTPPKRLRPSREGGSGYGDGAPGLPNMDAKRRGTSPRPTEESPVTSPTPNPSPLTSGSAPPKAPKKRRRTLYTLGASLRSNNQNSPAIASAKAGLETNNRAGRVRARSP